MTHSAKPPGTVTTGFRAAGDPLRWDRQPIYRIVEVSRDGDGRLRQEGRVWHNDLDHVRRFGRAVAANTASHRVMITDAQGDLIEELPVASGGQRQATWSTWGGVALPPAPPRRPKPRPEPARPLPDVPSLAIGSAVPDAEASTPSVPAANASHAATGAPGVSSSGAPAGSPTPSAPVSPFDTIPPAPAGTAAPVSTAATAAVGTAPAPASAASTPPLDIPLLPIEAQSGFDSLVPTEEATLP